MVMSVAKMPCATFRNELFLYDVKVLAPRPNIKLEENPLSAVRDFLFGILTVARTGSSGGKGRGHRLQGLGSIPGSAKFFSSPQRPDRLWGPSASYTMGTRSSFPGGKAAGA
jgi:hypothetical protein